MGHSAINPDSPFVLRRPNTETSSMAIEPVQSDKNKWIAAILAFLFGSLGVHKFYLGKTQAGIIMLVASLAGLLFLGIPTMIVAIVAFVEFIIYLVKDEQKFHEDYVAGDRAWF